MFQELPLYHDEQFRTFEIRIDQSTAFITYSEKNGLIELEHTVVPDELQGRGIAAILVEKTLRYLDERQLMMIPSCSYVKRFLLKHPEWKFLVG
ncbi:GNAT family N-acetyltransferase [Pedobacter sp. SYSU D00535]|uniref:GNAT family N-acetyltransferase n=1 Tax=Pedobacter sp. SYSU D00535 TaxID=2810308 RepID=UPI001A97844A|nr:GNAT family N-acetyltransferase [Pedobacter sp. SYSU D00535]